jgi:hypothetical protein
MVLFAAVAMSTVVSAAAVSVAVELSLVSEEEAPTHLPAAFAMRVNV